MPDGSIEIRTAFISGVLLSCMALGACRLDTEAPQSADAAMPPLVDAGMTSQNVYSGPLVDGEWQSLDFESRRRVMRELVMPTMRPLFQAFDAERFAAVSCSTCHGSGAQSGTFTMPSADVPALSRARLAQPAESDKAVLAFMRDTVKPKMAELLGEPDSLRCGNCHMSTP